MIGPLRWIPEVESQTAQQLTLFFSLVDWHIVSSQIVNWRELVRYYVVSCVSHIIDKLIVKREVCGAFHSRHCNLN